MIEQIDFSVLNFIQEHLRCTFLDFLFPVITHLGDMGIIWILIALVLLLFKRHRKTGITMIIGLVLGFIIGNLFLKNVVGRLRPFEMEEGIKLLIKAPKDPSFPSGHTLSSVTSATILFLTYKKRAIIFLILAFLIAFSRLYLYVHFPSDVIFGAILGVIIANLSIFFIKNSKSLIEYLK